MFVRNPHSLFAPVSGETCVSGFWGLQSFSVRPEQIIINLSERISGGSAVDCKGQVLIELSKLREKKPRGWWYYGAVCPRTWVM